MRRTAIIFGSLVVGLSVYITFASGGFLEADGVTHFLYARFAFEEPRLFVDVWGRPLVTTLHAGPAQVGVDAVRLVSLACWLAAAWWAGCIADGLGEGRWLAVMFTLASPLGLMHASGVLTELPFAAVLAGALVLYQRQRWAWCGLVVGLLPLARPEGFGLAACAAIALLAHRKPVAALLCGVSLVGWITAGWWIDGGGGVGDWLGWLPANWPYEGESVYAAGGWTGLVKYAWCLPVLVRKNTSRPISR